MKWPWRKPKKLNETTRLYALYGENANLEYLDSVDKQTIQRVEVVENNLQQTNQNLNQTNQNLTQTNQNLQNLTNRVDNLPVIDTSKFGRLDKINNWTKQQDFKSITTQSSIMGDVIINKGNINAVGNDDDAIVNKKFVLDKDRELQTDINNRLTNLSQEHNQFARKNGDNVFTGNNEFTKRLLVGGGMGVSGSAGFTGKILAGGGITLSSNHISNGTDVVNKEYVDNKVGSSIKRFNYYHRGVNILLNKKDVNASKEMFWYDIHSNQQISTNLLDLTPNHNYYYLILLNTINNQPCETYIASGSDTTDGRGTLRIVGKNLGGKTIVSWRDFRPGSSGDFTATLGFKILCIAL